MAIYRLLQNQAFDLGLRDRSDPLTQLVAERIVEYAQRGERDPIRLRHYALSSFKND